MVERSPALESLTAEERIALMGRLWDSLDPAAAAPVTAELAAELDRREAAAVSGDRVRIGLAGIALPARKLPQPTMTLVGGALTDEQRVAAANDRGDYALHVVHRAGRNA